MDNIIFYFPQDEKLAKKIAKKLNIDLGDAVFRRFPDEETYVQVNTNVENKNVILICGLKHPDIKLLPIIFFAETVRALKAKSVGLVAPYLAYLRQDTQFKPGEAVNSKIFGALLSRYIDWLITVDSHLHRHASLSEVYSIPAYNLHAADLIAAWIENNVDQPVLIGPDEESKQWVTKVAKYADIPYILLQKIRHGDREVEISVPEVAKYKNCTPVLVDDIISTARTMIETVRHLNNSGMKPTVCIGVHAIFVNSSYQDLLKEKIEQVITCNTIQHPTNKVDVSELIAEQITKV